MVAAPKRRAETFLASPPVFLSYCSASFFLSAWQMPRVAGEGRGYLDEDIYRRYRSLGFVSRVLEMENPTLHFPKHYLYYQTLDIYVKSQLFRFDHNLDNNSISIIICSSRWRRIVTNDILGNQICKLRAKLRTMCNGSPTFSTAWYPFPS